MGISASDVKALRDRTGAGMMDCKKALLESDGDMKKAEKILKELGLAAAAKRSDRATNEGSIFVRVGEKQAVILELSCETDFVAKNKDFIAMGEKMVDVILEQGITDKENPTLTGMVTDCISVIKENMALKRFTLMEIGENEYVSSYIHGGGSLGVLVKASLEDKSKLNDEVKNFVHDCALHIAAFDPMYFSQADISKEYIDEQMEIFEKQVASMGKPANVVEGIVKGKMSKHFSEICFLDQGFVKEEKTSVAKYAENLSKSAGTTLTLVTKESYRVGE